MHIADEPLFFYCQNMLKSSILRENKRLLLVPEEGKNPALSVQNFSVTKSLKIGILELWENQCEKEVIQPRG